MTDQLFVFLCRDVRKYAYDYRRGELQPAELRKFEEHLANCEACQDHVDRVEGMLDAAATHDFGGGLDKDALFASIANEVQNAPVEARGEPDPRPRTGPGGTRPIDRDALFARIAGQIDEDLRPVAIQPELLGEREETPANDTPDASEIGRRRSPVIWVAAGIAAGLLIGLGLPFLISERATKRPEFSQEQVDEPLRPDDGPLPASIRLRDLAMQPTPAAIEDVRVFGDPMASWSIRAQGTRRKLTLDAGTILVEFVPRHDEALEVVTGEFSVRVTGTVFYASVDEGVVGVVSGSVEVEAEDGEVIVLRDGQEWSVDDGLTVAAARVAADTARFVDLARHQALLDSKPARRAAPQRSADPVVAPAKLSAEVRQTPLSSLRQSAQDALRDGRYEVAAEYYERMVDELSPADPANASLRLDLARIYLRRLKRPDRAAPHLREFVRANPSDPATPTAREELCRISEQAEPLCEGE